MRIAFSGASHSGKTTIIEKLRSLNKSVVVLDEVIRDKNINIDEIRSSPNDYFDLQREIITKKYHQEIDSIKYDNVLIDRSLCDSLYYYLRYIDVNKLSNKNVSNYFEFLNEIYHFIRRSSIKVYDKVIVLEPIKVITQDDKYRPENLSEIQHSEFESIYYLVKENIPFNKIHLTNAKDITNVIKSGTSFFGLT